MTKQMTLAEALEIADKGESGQWSVLVRERTAALKRLAEEVRSTEGFRDMGTEIPEVLAATASAEDWQTMLEAPGFKLSLGARTAIALYRRVKVLESAVRLDTKLPQPNEAIARAEGWHNQLRRGADATSAARVAIVLLNMLRLTEDRLKEADREIQSLRAGTVPKLYRLWRATGREVSITGGGSKWTAHAHAKSAQDGLTVAEAGWHATATTPEGALEALEQQTLERLKADAQLLADRIGLLKASE